MRHNHTSLVNDRTQFIYCFYYLYRYSLNILYEKGLYLSLEMSHFLFYCLAQIIRLNNFPGEPRFIQGNRSFRTLSPHAAPFYPNQLCNTTNTGSTLSPYASPFFPSFHHSDIITLNQHLTQSQVTYINLNSPFNSFPTFLSQISPYCLPIFPTNTTQSSLTARSQTIDAEPSFQPTKSFTSNTSIALL